MPRRRNTVIHLKDYRPRTSHASCFSKPKNEASKIWDSALLLGILSIGIVSLILFTGQFQHLVFQSHFIYP